MSKQRVLVTGGTRGIGRELVRRLESRGAVVAVCGRTDPERLESSALGSNVVYFQCDLSDRADVERLASRLRADFLPTVVINNAGLQFNHDWMETSRSDRVAWAELEMEVDVMAPIRLTALLLDDLLSKEEAAIVNITSILALAPKRSAPVYSAAKAGLRAFTRGIRYQLASHEHVRVVEVLPPVVDTGMTAGRGSGKMDPADVAEEIVSGLERGAEEIWIGKARIVRALLRISPKLVGAILRNS